MCTHLLFVVMFLLGGLVGAPAIVKGQIGLPSSPSALPEEALQPDALAAQKATVQARLEALGKPETDTEEQKKLRSLLEQQLDTLTDGEEVLQKRAWYQSEIDALPQRLREFEAERKQQALPSLNAKSQVNDQLREQYEVQLQTARQEVQKLIEQTVEGEVRIAKIPQEMTQRTQARAQLEKELLAARTEASQMGTSSTSQLRIELLNLQIQVQNAELTTLNVERDWLIKREPLNDALLSAAQTRLRYFQEELNTVKQALGQTIQQEQAALSDTAASIAQRMQETMDPIEAAVLRLSLETVEIREKTTAYRQQLNQLGDEVLTQEKHNALLKQQLDRLKAVIEKYKSGEMSSPLLLATFERLQQNPARYRNVSPDTFQSHARGLNEKLFALDDKLYEFDAQAEERIARLQLELRDPTPQQREKTTTQVGLLLNEQKAALRDQQQVLTALVQQATKLLQLKQEYQQMFSESYFATFNELLWLRISEPLDWTAVRNSLVKGVNTLRHFWTSLYTETPPFQNVEPGSAYRWVLGLALLLLPLLLIRQLQKYGRRRIEKLSVRSEHPSLWRESTVVLVSLGRSALWPVYLLLVAQGMEKFFFRDGGQSTSSLAFATGLQGGAIVLWGWLFTRDLLRPNGWGQRFWGLNPDLCLSLRYSLAAIWFAALIFLIPRAILLAISGNPTVSTSPSSRLLLLSFQGIVLILLGIVGRRDSDLMKTALADSRQREGFLWQIWPFIHIAMLVGLLGIMILDGLGYCYAANYLWSRSLWSLAILFLLRVVIIALLWRLYSSAAAALLGVRTGDEEKVASGETANRAVRVLRFLYGSFLTLLVIGILLEVWGVSLLWLRTLPLIVQMRQHLILIAVTLGATIFVIQASRAVTDYLLQPRITWWGETREPSRQRQTLIPLTHTLVCLAAILIAVLVILEQSGVDTNPLLAGLGIFGLAIGFASQSLIKDVINGLFILFENSLSIGDVVTLRGIGGQVEKFTLRTVTLRDMSGNVHVIPNSSFDMVTNQTKEYSRYVLDVGVGYSEDVDTVVALLTQIDEEMRNDLDYRTDMLEPLEILGLDRFEDSAVIIRARLKTKPLKQWRIGREFNRRMKKKFDECNVEIPFPHRTLYWGKMKEKPQPSVVVEGRAIRALDGD